MRGKMCLLIVLESQIFNGVSPFSKLVRKGGNRSLGIVLDFRTRNV
jgi:hypothetical protein